MTRMPIRPRMSTERTFAWPRLCAAVVVLVLSWPTSGTTAPSRNNPPDVVLTGQIRREDFQSYRALPFRVGA